MGKLLNRRRLQIWIACFAILLNALAPTIAHALSAVHGSGPAIEICTADGVKYVSLDGSAPLQSPLDAVLHHLEHCPFCVGDASAPPLPPAFVVPLALTGGHAIFPSLYYQAPAPLFAWSQSHPRAPPAA